MQWHENFDEKKPELDAIEKTVDFIRPRWQRTIAKHDTLTGGSEFGLTPMESIREAVQVVPRDMFMSQTRNCSEIKKNGKVFVEYVLDGRVKYFTCTGVRF